MSVGQEQLEPGSYVSTTLGPTVAFELAEAGWVGLEDTADIGFALIPEGLPGGLSVVPFGGEVFTDPCQPAETATIERSAASFVEWLVEHPELTAGEPTMTTLGGVEAIQVDVTADVGEPCPEPGWNFLWVLPDPVGDFHLDEGAKARFLVADVADTTLVVVLEAFEASDFDRLIEVATPIVESITIEP